jgi:hypothetical protein
MHIFCHRNRPNSNAKRNMVNRFQGSGRPQEGGFLATHKQDFNAHVTGSDWRHDATHVDINPEIVGLGGATVHTGLENLLAMVASSGTGFVSIGDFDGYAQGSYNVGTGGYTSLREALLAAFADDRMQNGGIILILAGTYTLTSRVNIPPGISLMGEIGGTIIVGEMIEQSMFRIQGAISSFAVGGDSGSGTLQADAVNPLNETKIYNLILTDNLNGNVTQSLEPVSSMQTVPMIEIQRGTRVHFENVKFLGRVNNGAISGRGKTLRAIGYSSNVVNVGTHLIVRNCYFDGMETAIRFDSGNGDLDFLTIESCKARTFGSEDIAELTMFANNCFASTTLCNAKFVNNHHVSVGDFPDDVTISCFVVLSSNIGAGGSDFSFIITGNSGGNNVTTSPLLFATEVGVTIDSLKQIQYANSWGSSVSNTWFVTVGQQDSSGLGTASGIGDFLGSGAIDLLMSASFLYPTTIIINSGTYVVTSSGSQRYSLVGNAPDGNKPILTMNLASVSADEIGNRVFLTGARVENIQFKSDLTVTANYHSIRPYTNGYGNSICIRNCDFINTTLSVENISPAPIGQIFVENSRFQQNGDFDDNLCLLLPSIENVSLNRCTFAGNGYVGLIGSDTGISYTANPNVSTISLRDCVMNLSGSTISDASPLSIAAYLVIDSESTSGKDRVFIENCQILTDHNLGSDTTAINVALATSFLRYVFIRAREIYINDSLIHGPNQTFDVAGTDYPLPALELVPYELSHITNSRLMYGLPLRIGGTTESISTANSGGVFIDKCTLFSDSTVSASVLYIELDPDIGPEMPIVSLSNSKFLLDGLNALLNAPLSTLGGNYDAGGLVQIYAEDFEIRVSNCSIKGVIGNDTDDPPGAWDILGGLVVDNTNNGTATDTASVIISNNHIFVESDNNNNSTDQHAAACVVRGTAVNINNNHLQMNNISSISTSGVHCLYVDTRGPAGGSAPTAMVQGNIFSDYELDGTSGADLERGFIYLASGTESDGIVVNNIYTRPTDVLFNDQYSAIYTDDIVGSASWIAHTNKNQYFDINLSGTTATIQSLDGNVYPVTAIANLFVRGGGGGNEDPTISADLLFEASGGGVGSSNWNIYWELDRVIPPGAYVILARLQIHKQDTTISGTAVLRLRNANDDTSVNGTPTWDFGAQGNGTTVTSTCTTPDMSYKYGNVITANLDMNSFQISGASFPLSLGTLKVRCAW